MKKIYKLKKWLTLEETAERLSLEVKDDVTKGDILQLGIDGELKISIQIPIDVTAKKCEFVTREECTYQNIGADFILSINEMADEIKKKLGLDYKYDEILKEHLDKVGILNEKPLKDGRFIRISPNQTKLSSGIYELELIGNELLDLKWELSAEMDLPQADVTMLCGFYVKDKSNTVFEIQATLGGDEYFELQKEIKSDLKKTTAQSELSHLEKANIVEKINNTPFSKKIMSYPCPSINEIEGAFFVVQTEHLNEFLSSLDDDDNQSNLTLDNALHLLGEVLSIVKSKAKKWTQGDLIDEILQQRLNQNKTIQGLEKRKIDDYFSAANKKLKSD